MGDKLIMTNVNILLDPSFFVVALRRVTSEKRNGENRKWSVMDNRIVNNQSR